MGETKKVVDKAVAAEEAETKRTAQEQKFKAAEAEKNNLEADENAKQQAYEDLKAQAKNGCGSMSNKASNVATGKTCTQIQRERDAAKNALSDAKNRLIEAETK